MKYVLLIAGTVLAQAALSSEYKLFFIGDNGRQMDNAEAIVASAKGETVYKCQSVEFKVSKSGTSLSVKPIKKPKVGE